MAAQWAYSSPTNSLQSGKTNMCEREYHKKKGARRWFTECDIFFKGDQEDRKQKFSPQIEFNNWNNINNNNISTNRHLSKW